MPQAVHHASFSRGRRWGILLNVLMSCAMVLAVAAMINYLASRHYKRFQWNADTRYQLSPITLKMLAALTNDVKVIVFFDPDPHDSVYLSVKGLINEYQLACSKLEVEHVDYVRSPQRAELIKAQYKLAAEGDNDLIIFDSNGKFMIVYDKVLSEYGDVSQGPGGLELKRTAFKGEQFFTSAIVGITDPKPFKAYFLQGHGEHSPVSEDNAGYFNFARLLEERNISVEGLSLQTNDVPADCQLLIVAGVRHPLTPDELEKVESYLVRGGRAFFLFVSSLADARKSGLEQALVKWGVEVGDNLVIDRSQAKGQAQLVLVNHYGQHPIVKPLMNSQLAVVMPRSVRPLPSSSRPADTAKVVELAFTSEAGQVLKRGGQTVETNGIIPLMVAVEKGAIPGVNPDRGSTRIVVAGDSFFLGNLNIEHGANRDFANLAVNWLLDRSQLQAIGPRPVREYRILLTQSQLMAARWVLLGGLPGSVLLLGLLVWARRRK
ncbi:MAG TPA: GldG family protein [Verrucomicrobiae bacterium]|nr:GldG family protein [Verrucomicrobiae bacterium]